MSSVSEGERKAPLATQENNDSTEMESVEAVVVNMETVSVEVERKEEGGKVGDKRERKLGISVISHFVPFLRRSGTSTVRPCELRETEVMVKTDNGRKVGENEENKNENEPLSKEAVTGKKSFECSSFPKYARVVIAGAILILVTILVAIVALKSSRQIDLGPLITDGKYINTITSCGRVQGVIEDGAFAFRGLPYALPPTGDLRWKPSKIHDRLSYCWNGTLKAHNRSAFCWQFHRNGSYDGSEDCLYLDVFTPKVHYDTPLPVVVYIGSESLGGGDSSTLQPTALLAKTRNTVYVSVSIRKSVLGFLALDVLSGSAYPFSSGNYGLSDLLSALNWVQVNIEHFGGDRNRVILLGHQSGGTLASVLLSIPLPKPLFHGVWVSGGSSLSSLPGHKEAEVQNSGYMKEVGCSSLNCLLEKSPELLLEAVPYEWRAFNQDLPTKNEKKHHWLIKDGVIIRDSADVDVSVQSEVPIVVGSPAEVGASYEMYTYLDWNDTLKFSAYLESKFGTFGTSLSREVTDRYFRPESTPWQQFVSILSDVRTICPLYYFTTFLANQFQRERAYFYVSTQRRMTPVGNVADASADIAAILGVYMPANREEELYNRNMQHLFHGFVETGKFPDDMDVTKSIYLVDENIKKIFTYPNCDFWHQHNFYPKYAKVD